MHDFAWDTLTGLPIQHIAVTYLYGYIRCAEWRQAGWGWVMTTHSRERRWIVLHFGSLIRWYYRLQTSGRHPRLFMNSVPK
ncbi:hypothetical protein IQ07DRAFT_302614 [Pyrenochaeta sp. DS3sAY3a]|nr:hypothetical protein IQ07DRAFT_302614 [Pyrenochaeta sp. DS3sAY3a]